MMFVSLASAGAIVQSAAAEPAWLVPAITASATLLGTAVGGAMTFWTTRSANIRQEKAAEKRRKLDEIQDVAVRFIRLLTDQGYTSLRLKQVGDDIQDQSLKIENSSQASEDETQATRLGQLQTDGSPETGATVDGLKVADRHAAVAELVNVMADFKDLARAYGEIDAASKERDALIVEMSLILPAESVRKAEKQRVYSSSVKSRCIFREI
jgi:hypothetical protein